MSLQAALERIDALVGATVPPMRPDLPFNVVDQSRTEDGPAGVRGRTRTCSLIMREPPQDDGEAGATGLRRRVGLDLLIRYDVAQLGSRRIMDLAMGQDVDALLDAVVFTPAGWQAGATGIDTIYSAGAPSLSDVSPDQRDRVATVLTVPFTLIYREGT